MSTMQNGCGLHSGASFTLETVEERKNSLSGIRLLQGCIGALNCTVNDIINYSWVKNEYIFYSLNILNECQEVA